MTVMSVMMVSKPPIYAVSSMTTNMTITMTVPRHTSRHSHAITLYVKGNDDHDAYDDELQRFSEGGAALYGREERCEGS